MFMVYIDGMRSGLKATRKQAMNMVALEAKGRPYKIVSLTETKIPKANKMGHHEGIENKGAYKYNPIAMIG